MKKIIGFLFLFVFKSLFATSLEITPNEITANLNQRIKIGILLTNATETIGCEFSLLFPGSLVGIERIEKGTTSIYNWLTYKVYPNEIKITTAISPNTTPTSGSGTIANIYFITKKPGMGTLSTSNGYLIREYSKEMLSPSSSTINITTSLPYLEFENIPDQRTHQPFTITIYAKDENGMPLSLTSPVYLDDYTHTIMESITINGTYTTGTATILKTPNKGINRITGFAGTISGISNEFIVFANYPYEHTIDIPCNSGTISVDIGSSTIGDDYYIDVDENISGIIELPEGNISIGIRVEVSTSSGTIEGSLTVPFRIEMPYKEENLGGIDENTLRLYVFKDNSWHQTKDSNVDTIKNIVSGYIDHLCFFTILGSKTSTSYPSLFFPNPYYAKRHNKITFSPDIKEVFVYNIKGEFIKEIRGNIWHNPENHLSSGVYLLILKDSNKRYVRKLGIVK